MLKPLLAGGLLVLAGCAAPVSQSDKFGAGLSPAQAAQIRFLKSDDSITTNERDRRIERVLGR